MVETWFLNQIMNKRMQCNYFINQMGPHPMHPYLFQLEVIQIYILGNRKLWIN